jgi:hypothetical protein
MKLLAFALLLFCLQSSSVSAGKKVNARYHAQNSTRRTYRSETLIAQNSAPPLDNTSQGASGNRAAEPTQTVRVSDLPPLSIAKDWSDRAYWLFTFFLAAIGGLQVFLLWGNLRAIERQANQMEHQTMILEKTVSLAEKNAETARQNIEMFVNRERAHLKVEVALLEWPLRPGLTKLKYKVTLYGASEAYIVGSCARAEIMDSLEPQDDAKWWPAMSIPQVISPNNRVMEAVAEGIFPKMNLEQADIDALAAAKKFLHFRGFIRYDDVFGAERMTRFRRAWEVSNVGNQDGTPSGRWGKRGSPKDNSET